MRDPIGALAEIEEADRRAVLAALREADRRALEEDWPSWAREGQTTPPGDWRVWVLMAGRGFGKTRAGAEWVSAFARANPGAAIALVAATAEEARAVMIEGRSGLLGVAAAAEREAMIWEPTRRRLTFASGAEAFVYSAANPECLRGPEHHLAWCDELAKWKRAETAWNNLQLGLRLKAGGAAPRALVTTTPRGVPALKRILAAPGLARSGGPTWANPHLAEEAVAALAAEHGGTRFGRQELEGVMIEEVAGALWTRDLIERCRAETATVASDRPRFARVVVGVDPPASAEGDECGIVVCAKDAGGMLWVLADMSAGGLSPDGWARRVAAAAGAWDAHRVAAEKNNGGAMVESVLRAADAGLPVRLVHASEGKAARAEPVAALFESGKARLAGRFPELEDQLCAISYDGYEGAGSPDRADAMVWAMSELIRPGKAPRVRFL